ncbi:hypothetical protein ACFE33_15540 (plasmid) [Falsihalocynthiibacter sp. SS001]|uniref:hypothetical protein n=1 Tax=Falsihalocynthiibacter sp. SS001 TaxID=3349698 RepID=UPI0036D31A9F
MVALSLRQDYPQSLPSVPAVAPEWRGMLDTLRSIARECRTAAQSDLFNACAVLSTQKAKARDAHARVLLKCLQQATNRKPTFFRPGTQEVTFDEAWLVRAVVAATEGDDDSFAFLLRSRVPPLHQRQVGFLLIGISEQFSKA